MTFRVAFVVLLAAVGRQVCGYLAAGNNGPDGSVCFMEGQHHAGEITG